MFHISTTSPDKRSGLHSMSKCVVGSRISSIHDAIDRRDTLAMIAQKVQSNAHQSF